ncbi:MAG: hypothetical protein ACRD4R_09720 [Candidatus Acidiferrales bacterium]
MSSSARGPSIKLSELIERYLAVSGGYGKPAALGALGLLHADAESAFSLFDEDYLISRYLHFQNDAGEQFHINGFPQTHVSIDTAIQSIL